MLSIIRLLLGEDKVKYCCKFESMSLIRGYMASVAAIKCFCYLANVDFQYMQGFHRRHLAARVNDPRYVSEYRKVNGIISLRISGHSNILDLRTSTESLRSPGISRRIRMLGFSAENQLSYTLKHHLFDIDLKYYLKLILPYLNNNNSFEYLTQLPRRNISLATPLRLVGNRFVPY
ncbi:hypothetical protein L7G72_13245 [Xenorhabdus bovienii]|uniref:hypothetical protein n=1 Tax=Xenorhabdus bovienii TaxID=40576 RepID=UPI001EDD7E47|nr:hypothetical protein [Xenorhabdus bovienii]MCG3462800.1 hypothetical protein [Xenorhabdus bovienii]